MVRFEQNAGNYEYYFLYTNSYGTLCKGQRSGQLHKTTLGQMELTLLDQYYNYSLRLQPVRADSATLVSQEVKNLKDNSSFTVIGGGVKITNGEMFIEFRQRTSNWPFRATLYRSDRQPGPLPPSTYLGSYEASPEWNNIFNAYLLTIESGAKPHEVMLHNVLGQGITVPGYVSGDTLYTQRTPMLTPGNFLSATKSVISGNTLHLGFMMEGPGYSPSSPSSSAAVKCYKAGQ
ncbi:MAG TPA: hypothetical protein PK971_07145 [Saprospiraceae bacterium]|nr:hypothetical protein [Saprospiraceae bacterium]HND88084.1 hypothetical protein [Saprospiraceae bacterium]